MSEVDGVSILFPSQPPRLNEICFARLPPSLHCLESVERGREGGARARPGVKVGAFRSSFIRQFTILRGRWRHLTEIGKVTAAK